MLQFHETCEHGKWMVRKANQTPAHAIAPPEIRSPRTRRGVCRAQLPGTTSKICSAVVATTNPEAQRLSGALVFRIREAVCTHSIWNTGHASAHCVCGSARIIAHRTFAPSGTAMRCPRHREKPDPLERPLSAGCAGRWLGRPATVLAAVPDCLR